MSLGVSAAGWAAIGAIGVTGASIYGSNKASSTQEQAAQQGQAEAAREFDLSRSDTLAQLAKAQTNQQPYLDAGKGALAQIMAGLSTGGQFAQKFDNSTFQQDPGYQFQQQQGEAAINRAAAASGAGYSGATLKALARFNTGLASQDYNNAYQRFTNDKTTGFNRLASVAGLGQTATNQTNNTGTTATGQLATLGANFSNTNATLLGNMGEARASGYVANSNALGSGIKSLYNAYQAGPWTTGGNGGTVENVLI